MRRKNHKDLVVWQKALTLAQTVHQMTQTFPRHELFGLTNQLRRAAISIPSNIAEGAARGTTREFIHYLHIARGSFAELETQLHLASRFGYVRTLDPVSSELNEVGKLLNAVIRGLREKLSRDHKL